MIKKELQKSTERKNLKLFIFSRLKEGRVLRDIKQETGLKDSAFQYYLSSLKQEGLIKKIGYGVWETTSNSTGKELQKSTAVATHQLNKICSSLKPDSVRGHAFQFKLQIPKNLRNWNRREEFFKKLGIKFKKLQVPANSQAIEFKGRKIHLTDKSIIIYERESFIQETAAESQSQAIDNFLRIIKSLERELKANFGEFGKYRFKVSRQHYSLIKNALAKQYDKEGKKLEVYNDTGLWFLIDNSFNLHEAETLHPKTAVSDNEKVQTLFNGIKEENIEHIKGFKPSVIFSMINKNTENLGEFLQSQVIYAENIKSHIKAIQQLGDGVDKQNKIMDELLKAVKGIRK